MSTHEVNKDFPKKRIYKRLGPSQNRQQAQTQPSGLPPEDLTAFQELIPKLSPKGQEIISLLVRIFNEKGEINPNQLLQMVNQYTGQEKSGPQKNFQSHNLSPLLSMLPLLTSSLGNQSINPTVLASLLSMLAANRPRD